MTERPGDRGFTRVPVRIAARLTAEDGSLARGRVRDVSMSGLSLDTNDTLPVGVPCRVRIDLNTGGAPLAVEAHGRVVRSAKGVLAVALTSVDADGAEHLRKLVMYNAPSADAFEREIEERADDQPPIGPPGEA